jgi:hypothetical protein
MAARTGFSAHETDFARTKTKTFRTKRKIGARMGFLPHEKRFSAHERENGRTKPEISRTKQISSARSPSGRPPRETVV